jgi:phospholipid-binding lipoprotein MlaA
VTARAAVAGLLGLALLAGGCATTAAPGAADAATRSKADPWEAFNRKVFAFNDAIDEALLKPLAEGYRKAVPEVARTAVGNMLGNLEDAWSAANQLLQGKPKDGLDMGLRVVVNSTLGLAGAIDIAGEAGIERRSEDFGQTLGRWGLKPGPYLVLPLLGPRSTRDAAALPFDRAASLGNRISPASSQYALTFVQVVHVRSELLGATNLVGGLALDRYTFVRDAYLARRRSLVYDGDPPEQKGD